MAVLTESIINLESPKPNWVSSKISDTDSLHYVQPLQLEVWDKIKSLVELLPRCELQSESENLIHITFKSLICRFVDDVVFEKSANEVHISSSSRTGHSDFGVNRKRVERVRGVLNN